MQKLKWKKRKTLQRIYNRLDALQPKVTHSVLLIDQWFIELIYLNQNVGKCE